MRTHELSAAQLRQAADVKEKLEAAESELAAIFAGGEKGGDPGDAGAGVMPGKKLHWTQTPEGRARLARTVRASWRKRRA
jgi:hypothetical protein